MEVEVAIIGGGIVGFAAASFLASHRSVAVIEAEPQPGRHSTGRSAAVSVEAYEGPLVRALTSATRRYLIDQAAALSELPLMRPRGHLIIASEDRVASLRALAEAYADISDRIDLIGPDAARRHCPILRPEATALSLWEPGALDIDVDALFQSFIRRAKANGARVLTHWPVETITRVGVRWRLRSGEQTVLAETLVDAAGGWAGTIAAMAGAEALPLAPLLRTALLVDPPAGAQSEAWPFVVTEECDVYFKPEAGKLMVSPADERPVEPCDAWPDDMDVAIAVDRLQRIADIPVRRVAHSWAGLRTFAPDHAPIVGWDAAAPGFCWAAGLGGFGVQTSAAVGALVAQTVTGSPIANLPLPLDLARALGPARLGRAPAAQA